MRILVTGGSGFIADHVLNYLITKTRHEIIVTTRDLKRIRSKSWFDEVKVIECDIYDSHSNWFSFLDMPDLLIHLAWGGLPNYTSSFHMHKNLPKQIEFLENLIDNGLKELVITGTCFEYGLQEGELFEEMDTRPDNYYGIAKDSLRRFLNAKQKLTRFSLKWLRLFYLFGPGQNEKSLFSQLDRAIKNGESEFKMSKGKQIRDYLPIEKAAEIICELSLDSKIEGIFNISSGQPRSIKDLVEGYLNERNLKLKLHLGYFPYSPLEPMNFWGNPDKIKHLL